MVQWLGCRLGAPETWVQFIVLPQTSCITMGKSLVSTVSLPCPCRDVPVCALPVGSCFREVTLQSVRHIDLRSSHGGDTP